MAGPGRDAKVVLRQEAAGYSRYISANRTTPCSGAAWRTSINNITDVYDLRSPRKRKAPSREPSPCPYTRLNPNWATLLFSHFDMVSLKQMRTSHFKGMLKGGELRVGNCGNFVAPQNRAESYCNLERSSEKKWKLVLIVVWSGDVTFLTERFKLGYIFKETKLFLFLMQFC